MVTRAHKIRYPALHQWGPLTHPQLAETCRTFGSLKALHLTLVKAGGGQPAQNLSPHLHICIGMFIDFPIPLALSACKGSWCHVYGLGSSSSKLKMSSMHLSPQLCRINPSCPLRLLSPSCVMPSITILLLTTCDQILFIIFPPLCQLGSIRDPERQPAGYQRSIESDHRCNCSSHGGWNHCGFTWSCLVNPKLHKQQTG
jgi:hypothetical protein